MGGVQDVEQDHEGRTRHHPEQGCRYHRTERRAFRDARDARQRQADPRNPRNRRCLLGRSLPLLRRRAPGRYRRGRHAARQHDVARAARTHRRRRPDRAVELPVPHGRLEARPRARRRRLHGVQALFDDLAHRARAREAHAGCYSRGRVQRRHGPRIEVGSVHPREQEDQQTRLHRLHRGRPRRRPRGGGAPDPRHTRARRQIGEHHLP